ncbi:protein doublesex isoform X3 [Eupeodes corollae]|uniref:protein doublesex isoform X3 n=2 Tax=Eupeodes corollae TaxID=290404 RepID=UPI0024922F12|nr:protein doublesex isoform X3 [Eupeodes corollae]
MSDSDLMDSKADVCGGASSSSGSSVSPRTPPNCARCKNHGLKINLKGHKRYCKYRCCNCEKCRLTSDRQKIMALQTSWRRAQAQDEARSLLMGEVPPIRPVSSFLHHHLNQQQINKIEGEHSKDRSEPAPPQPSLEGSCDSSSSPSSPSGVATSTILRKLTPIQANGSHMPFGQSAEVFLEYCQKLLEKFRYPWEMMPLMYVILKDAKADIEEASRRIDEGTESKKKRKRWRAIFWRRLFPFWNRQKNQPGKR